ncbi:MAG: hypothetical protein HYV09_05690 [Deltaproteobacteria bacterium]|nr:hypothetical protein [Deltaproteobacteria bacterium]
MNGPGPTYTATARRRLPNGKIRTFGLEGAGSPTGDAVRVGFTISDQ